MQKRKKKYKKQKKNIWNNFLLKIHVIHQKRNKELNNLVKLLK